MLPMQYVRKKPKGFGRNAQIEGHLEAGDRVLLVEDMTSDGRSKVNFCKALREAGASVEHCFVVFFYDIFPEGKKILSDLGVTLHSLATWWDVLEAGEEKRPIREGQAQRSREIHEGSRRLVEGAWRRRPGRGVVATLSRTRLDGLEQVRP